MSKKKRGIRLENHVFELCAGNLERKLHNPRSRLRVADRLVELAKEQVDEEDVLQPDGGGVATGETEEEQGDLAF